MSGVYDIAVWAPKGGGIATDYQALSGSPLVPLLSATMVPRVGNYTAIAALATSNGFFVSRVEWRAGGVSGTLVGSDDFGYADLTALAAGGWVAGPRGGAASVGGGEVRINGGGFSQEIYKLTPAGADTLILRGCRFPTETSLHWGMGSLHYDPTAPHFTFPSEHGMDGYTGYPILLRELHPHNLELLYNTGPSPLRDPQPSAPLLRQRQTAA